MRITYKFYLVFLCATLLAIACDDDCPSCDPLLPNEMELEMDTMVIDTMQLDTMLIDTMAVDTMFVDSCLGYSMKEVEFYTIYPLAYRVIPATFETVTEQILVKEAGTTGSTYEVKTESVLLKDAYNTIKITSTDDSMNIKTDLKEDSTQIIPCIGPSYATSYETEDINATYTTITHDHLETYSPDGDTIFAQYETRSYQKLVNPAEVEELEDHQKTTTITFTLPDSVDIYEYLNKLAMDSGFPDCLREENYMVK